MMHEKFHYHSIGEINQKAEELGAFLPMQEDVSPLFAPVKLGKHTAANRIALQPMEGSDGLEDGTLGELIPQDNFKGIYDFKKSFSADYHEFIGEYILVGNKAKYYSYAKLMPTAKKAKISLVKLIRR